MFPVEKNDFAGQSPHAAELELSLYFPDRHNTHVVPSSPVVPGLHLQSDKNADAWDELELSIGSEAATVTNQVVHASASRCANNHVIIPLRKKSRDFSATE
jgi:hypothetical protein